MRPKRFVIIFITYVYTIDIPNMGSHRDMFRVYVFIVIVLDCTISCSKFSDPSAKQSEKVKTA